MSVAARAPLGGLSPLACVLNISPGSTGMDLTSVTSAVILARNAAGVSVSWACTLSSQTFNTLTLTHNYLAGDLPAVGLISLYANLTVPSGLVPTTSVQLTVYDPFTA